MAGPVVHCDLEQSAGLLTNHNQPRRAKRPPDAGLLGSTGHVGACVDNEAMESFFALPQKNFVNRRGS